MSRRELDRAVAAVEKHGILLVYPMANRSDPPSLWSVLHPCSEMRWAWDDGGDPRVVALWHLRAELAESRRVVYTKWFQGRATMFSRDVFRSMLGELRALGDLRRGSSPDALRLLAVLEESSPRGTKELRAEAELQGKYLEGAFTRAMRMLWSHLLIVGAGEAEEGGFPSLMVAATQLLFEDLWEGAATLREDDRTRLARVLESSPSFARTYRRSAR